MFPDAIRAAFDCLVVIVHHCGHDDSRPRGHSSLIAAVDTQIAVSRDAADNIIAKLELSKDSEIGLTFVSRLKVVDIGVDQDGDPITSCVVEAVEGPVASEAGKRGKKQPKSHQAMLRALQQSNRGGRRAGYVEHHPRIGACRQGRHMADLRLSGRHLPDKHRR